MPAPEAPEGIEIQATLLEAVQEQTLVVVTVTVPVPAPARAEAVLGAML